MQVFSGAMASFLPGEGAMEMMSAGAEPSVLTVTMAWTAVLAMGCTAALMIAHNIYLHRPWLDSRTGLLAFGGGFIFGAVSGYLAQVFFSLAVAAGQGNPLVVEMSRVVAWVIFGGFVGLGMSFVIPNLGKERGAVAGAFGGGVGAISFIFGGAIAGDVAVRAIGLSIIGFTLGYAIGPTAGRGGSAVPHSGVAPPPPPAPVSRPPAVRPVSAVGPAPTRRRGHPPPPR